MEKKRNDSSWVQSVPTYLWALFFVSMLLAGATTYAFLKQSARVGILEEKLNTTTSAYDDCINKLSDLKSDYQKLKADFDQLDKDYESCRLSILLKDGDIAELNEEVAVLAEYIIHYDRLMSALIYYRDVNTCTDFIAQYYEMKSIAQDYLNFVRDRGDILEDILTDDLAQRFGYDYGFRKYDAISIANQFLSNLDWTYNYCVGG